jgi:hypothetical protein
LALRLLQVGDESDTVVELVGEVANLLLELSVLAAKAFHLFDHLVLA